MSDHLALGRKGENLAADFLINRGLKLIERNVRTPFGEIDLVLLDGDMVVFTEVKARTTSAFGGPFEAVGSKKRQRLSKAALSFLKRKGWLNRRARFDVVGVIFAGPKPQVDHLADAFDLVQ